MKPRTVLTLSAAVAPLVAILYVDRREAARRGYQDLTAQAEIRTVLTVLATYWIDHQELTSDPDALPTVDPRLPELRRGDRPAVTGGVYIDALGDGVVLSAQSQSGVAFYLFRDRDVQAEMWTGYAHDALCRAANEQHYSSTGWKNPLSRWQRFRRDRRAARRTDPATSAQLRAAMAMVGDIHHFGLTVTDVDASAAWYEQVLGFRRVDEYTSPDGERRKVFLRHFGLRARLGLTQHAHGSKDAFDETRVGLDHLAFGVSSREELDEWTQRFSQHRVVCSAVAPSNTIPGAAVLVFRDTDNIQLELFFDPSTNVR